MGYQLNIFNCTNIPRLRISIAYDINKLIHEQPDEEFTIASCGIATTSFSSEGLESLTIKSITDADTNHPYGGDFIDTGDYTETYFGKDSWKNNLDLVIGYDPTVLFNYHSFGKLMNGVLGVYESTIDGVIYQRECCMQTGESRFGRQWKNTSGYNTIYYILGTSDDLNNPIFNNSPDVMLKGGKRLSEVNNPAEVAAACSSTFADYSNF
jgi:hypothetical protein